MSNQQESHQLKPITEPFSVEVAEILSRYPQQDGYLLSLFRVFGNSVRFLRKGVANLLDKESPLTLRQRELVILRTCANTKCEYEWGVHVAIFAGAAGINKQQVAETVGDLSTEGLWSDDDLLLLRCVDELCEDRAITTHLRFFQNTWDLDQQLEILALVGNYHTISMVARTAGLKPEPFAARFPG